MAIAPRLELRQGQALVMTPQLQQAIKLLQLSNIELSAYVDGELEQNPLLERDDDNGDSANGDSVGDGGDDRYDDGLDGSGALEAGDGEETGGLESMDFTVPESTTTSPSADLDIDYDNLWNNDSPGDAVTIGPTEGHGDGHGDNLGGGLGDGGGGDTAFSDWGSRGGGGFDTLGADLEQTIPESKSLRNHLIGQLNMDIDDPVDRMIGLHLIDLLDEAGYISGDIAVIADLLNCDIGRVEATLARLQHLDPPGIFARDLAECLALQLRDLNRLDPAMQALLDNLDLLAKRDSTALIKRCGVDAEDLADMVAEIRALDPKPALAFDHAVAQPITPDIFMRRQAGAEWVIELNNDTLPKVLVNNHYYARISHAVRSKADKQYVNEALQSANWLVKSLHQRATTILKVAGEIIRQQEAFFDKGVQHLRPLVLRDIAVAIDMHESTVSRVTSNKYMATPRGIYELKYFFTPAIGNSIGGATHSAESVRQRIKVLTEAETADKVLSDDKIVDILHAESVEIARRTVAKYRESLGIPSSVQRRREKANCF